jgi:GNAT superfamily N-acetyltransferase
MIRTIRADELPGLMELYRHLHEHDVAPPAGEELAALWEKICADPKLVYVVAEVEGRLVSTCALAIVPNLTRGGRPYGLIENVVTHADYRRRGLGTMVLRKAAEIARERGCYKVMLLTGRKLEATLRFYEKVGFLRGVKTGFVMVME